MKQSIENIKQGLIEMYRDISSNTSDVMKVTLASDVADKQHEFYICGGHITHTIREKEVQDLKDF